MVRDEPAVERSGEAGAGGRSSDSTDGAKERMMIEWRKARHREEGTAKKENQTLREGKGPRKGREGDGRKEMSNNRRTTQGRKQEV